MREGSLGHTKIVTVPPTLLDWSAVDAPLEIQAVPSLRQTTFSLVAFDAAEFVSRDLCEPIGDAGSALLGI